ncbi:MAG TPA: T9SS type A sorting domain-containing protein, partial [Flavisolibacter sp.]
PTTLVATTTSGSDGTWSSGSAAATPAPYNAVSGASYYATAQNGTCGLSNASATVAALTPTPSSRCGTITGPVTPNVTGINGALTGSFTSTTVNLYLDGTFIGTTATNSNSWGPIAVNTADKNTALYPNGMLTIGLMETGKSEIFCPLSATSIACSPMPLAPTITPQNSTTTQNGTVTYTIANATAGTFYALSDSTSGEALGTGSWAPSTGALSISTKQLSTTKTYTVLVKATSLSGVNMCTSLPGKATIVVSSILPANLLHFTGHLLDKGVVLVWDTEEASRLQYFEVERSADGTAFRSIARRGANNGVGKISYAYEDAAPETGRNFYRLKLVDDDGSYAYSKTLLFTLGEERTFAIAPNPFKDELSVSITLPLAQKVEIVISNVAGSVVKRSTLHAAAGPNSPKIRGLGQLPKGVYLLKVYTGTHVLQQKIMKID